MQQKDKVLDTLTATEQIKHELAMSRHVRVASPFVTDAGIQVLMHAIKQLSARKTLHLQMLTRFDPESILSGVCDLSAIEMLLAEAKPPRVIIEIKRLDVLHAKYFVFDEKVAIIGSANMTAAAQSSNIELSYYTINKASVHQVVCEFDCHWPRGFTIDNAWITEQRRMLEPFKQRYEALRTALRGLTIIQSIRMPEAESDFLRSLKLILKKAREKNGVKITWLEQEMRRAQNSSLDSSIDEIQTEAKFNFEKRLTFLELLSLIERSNDAIKITPIGQQCYADNGLLLQRMIQTFPILKRCYQATDKPGVLKFRDIINVEPDARAADKPSQTLRDAVHWLSAFGVLSEGRNGNSIVFRRKKSPLSALLE